jgi:hypothetical protein
MSDYRLNGIEFQGLTRQILYIGCGVRFQACGGSMQPFIHAKDILEIAPLTGKQIKYGDVLLVESGEGRLLAHRVVKTNHRNSV